ncbi:glycosyltransferase [Anabaena azotica]|nr:glycosyltransferase family 4 protein [Anabaena azotica]
MNMNEYIRDRTLIQTYLSAADIYTLPSRHEGFPVVATDATGIPDILQNQQLSGGLIVSREDSTALAQALGSILDNQPWEDELDKKARDRAEKAFSLKAIGQQLREFLLINKS